MCNLFKKKQYKTYRSNNEKNMTSLMNPTLVSFRMDRSRYHDGDLEKTSILKLFQNSNKIFHAFKIKIMNIITDNPILTNLDYQVNRYIEICSLFDFLFWIN